jgi:hypothetical protein
MTRLIIFRCPGTGLQVQTPITLAERDESDSFEAVKCLACTQMHFVSRRTGKVLGDRK